MTLSSGEPAAVRKALPEDSASALSLLHECFTSSQLGLGVYSSIRSTTYLERALLLDHRVRPTRHFSLGPSSALQGYAELTGRGAIATLSYIAVSRADRGSGAARALLRAGLRSALEAGCTGIELDVFADNVIASAWYARLGFESVSSRTWWSADPSKGVESEPLAVVGLPQAEMLSSIWGFGHASIGSGRQNLLLLGDDSVRLQCAPAEVGGALCSLFIALPARRVVVSADGQPADLGARGCTPIIESLRLRGDIADVMGRL